MPPSMRRMTVTNRTRSERAALDGQNRSHAVHLIRTTRLPTTQIANTAGISTTTCHRLRMCILFNDHDTLQKMLDPAGSRGRQSCLTPTQEQMISERLLFAGRRGFAADIMDLKRIMAQTAALNGTPYPNGLPFDDTIRYFRAKHRELSFHNYEAKDLAKIKGENFDHVDSFFQILENVEKLYPGMMSDGDRIWNFDETKVDPEFGKKIKVFSDALSNHGGSRAASSTSGSVRHVTIVIASSASGKVCPPFFVVEGKQVMSKWLSPIEGDHFRGADATLLAKLSTPGWFPVDGAIFCTNKGSMEKDIMPLLIAHINRYVRKFVSREKHYLVTMDGHASRKGHEWVETYMKFNCEAVLAPPNTSHFLQPCDQAINKRFQTEVRAVRDHLAAFGIISVRSIQFKLMCGVIAHERITVNDCVRSFCETGIFPLDITFAERFRKTLVLPRADEEDIEENDVERETETLNAARDIVNGTDDTARALQRLSILLDSAKTTNSIIMSLKPKAVGDKTVTAGEINVVLYSGAAAEYLTVGEALEKRKEEARAREAANLAKQKAREERERAREAKNARKAAEKEAKEFARQAKKAEKEKTAAAKRAAAMEKKRKAAERSCSNGSGRVASSVDVGSVMREHGLGIGSPSKSPARKIFKRFQNE